MKKVMDIFGKLTSIFALSLILAGLTYPVFAHKIIKNSNSPKPPHKNIFFDQGANKKEKKSQQTHPP